MELEFVSSIFRHSASDEGEWNTKIRHRCGLTVGGFYRPLPLLPQWFGTAVHMVNTPQECINVVGVDMVKVQEYRDRIGLKLSIILSLSLCLTILPISNHMSVLRVLQTDTHDLPVKSELWCSGSVLRQEDIPLSCCTSITHTRGFSPSTSSLCLTYLIAYLSMSCCHRNLQFNLLPPRHQRLGLIHCVGGCLEPRCPWCYPLHESRSVRQGYHRNIHQHQFASLEC